MTTPLEFKLIICMRPRRDDVGAFLISSQERPLLPNRHRQGE